MLYRWKLTNKTHGRGWTQENVEKNFTIHLNTYSLLFLNEQLFLNHPKKGKCGVFWKMLLQDKNFYKHPAIIWVRPDWVSKYTE